MFTMLRIDFLDDSSRNILLSYEWSPGRTSGDEEPYASRGMRGKEDESHGD
jgi:hypothetical protein